VSQRLDVEEVRSSLRPVGIADHARSRRPRAGTAGARELEAAHEQLPDEVADVQRVGGRIEADVEPDRSAREARRERARSVVSWMRPRAASSSSRSMAAPMLTATVAVCLESYTLAQAFERQSPRAKVAGSPMYASLLNGLLADYLAGGFTAEILEGVSDTPLHDATPLRYLAVGHRLALEGARPDLAAIYPSCGGPLGRTRHHRRVPVDGRDEPRGVRARRAAAGADERGRAAPVLASGLRAALRPLRAKPLDLLEIGSSAGLLSQWDHYFYDTGVTHLGDPASPLQFGPEW
jgi:hypothetical protein